jgi:hypothetical protein
MKSPHLRSENVAAQDGKNNRIDSIHQIYMLKTWSLLNKIVLIQKQQPLQKMVMCCLASQRILRGSQQNAAGALTAIFHGYGD